MILENPTSNDLVAEALGHFIWASAVLAHVALSVDFYSWAARDDGPSVRGEESP